MNDYKIEKAGLQDLPIIQQIANETWRPTYGSILTEEQTLFMLEMMYSDASLTKQFETNHFLIFSDNDKPVGFSGFEKKEKMIKLHKIYFLPETQGKGFGKMMIQEIVKVAQAENCDFIELNVNRNNKAKNFYEKLGFEVVNEIDINIGNGYWMNDYVMHKIV
ncbi:MULTISPECIES: GNAT family N-acetyltransferase [unclassified Arcicella]|uniref:GNAT family N-acetyltransferase n=1 Tax=unclassified Arcicella TaxID=2644986 RepID=UPI0028630CBF|nr:MULTISPECIES: GNAT family N-acetyltransferase [unclassified Arcicella]MDR6561884.1 ribosomal protein S18 acetylase RimI-like enzyme [Arcicella sp. BE51]MDR6814030.1 ribosomal protein S18 acetylase RimI-like enzyme [Arcicella sp. BE140]MDR6825263.1 ribosomal protein S18 acetylase RimI-like enzyme [Arcicella sp. BE139]